MAYASMAAASAGAGSDSSTHSTAEAAAITTTTSYRGSATGRDGVDVADVEGDVITEPRSSRMLDAEHRGGGWGSATPRARRLGAWGEAGTSRRVGRAWVQGAGSGLDEDADRVAEIIKEGWSYGHGRTSVFLLL